MTARFSVTTPIYYVNDKPHIGHLYTTLAADVLTRFHRLRGEATLFLTGTDEHAQKVVAAAEKLGRSPLEHCDLMSSAFREAFDRFGFDYTRFIRTTDADHKAAVADLVQRMKDNGDIYSGDYEGWYNPSDEEFVPATQVKDGKDSFGRPLVYLKERTYFFALSRYQEQLRDLIASDTFQIRPEGRRNEVLSFVEGGLRDLSMTRTGLDWGIAFPGDPEHVVYVWVDALVNYLTGAGFGTDPQRFAQFWPADLHLVGKDIIRFHCVIWPAMLLSAGLALPRKVFAHGWWTNQGQKMSKSLGNFITPETLLEGFEIDPIRYFLLREIPFGEDGDFNRDRLIERFNSDLANDLGNALNRSLSLLDKYYGGRVPTPGPLTEADRILSDGPAQVLPEVSQLLDEVLFDRALIRVWEYIGHINKYIDSQQPWALYKAGTPEATERLGTVLYTIMEALRFTYWIISPFMPQKMQQGWEQLGFDTPLAAEPFSQASVWGRLPAAQMTRKAEVLFKRMERETPVSNIPPASRQKKEAAMSDTPQPSTPPANKPAELPAVIEHIDYDHFAQVQLRSGRIVEAERVPKSDKLLRLQVDLGTERRQIVAGIGKAYQPEALVGKQVVIVANLKPAKIFGVESNGMLLACGGTEDLKLVGFDGEVTLGERVK